MPDDISASPITAHYLPCPSCGSQLSYSAENQKITCKHCGYQEAVNSANDKVVEQDLESAASQAPGYHPQNLGKKVIDCQNCGANFMVDAQKVKVSCGFCGSVKVNTDAYQHRFFQPQGIIPFYISRRKAEESFRKWIKQGIFHPNKLKRLAKMDSLHGIYIPFWTYDARTQSRWSGEAGYYLHSPQGLEQMPQTIGRRGSVRQARQQIRWRRQSGTLNHFFDDIQVAASGGLQQTDIERIMPFKTDEVVNFDPRLLTGWEAEVYEVDVQRGYQIAEVIMDQKIRNMVAAQLGGDQQRNLSVSSTKTDLTFKHIILPVWICSYEYMGKVYHFMINGQTGKTGGEKPTSYFKIGLMIGVFIAFLVVLWLLREYN